MASGGSGSRRLRFDNHGGSPRGPRFVETLSRGNQPHNPDPLVEAAVTRAIQHLLARQHDSGCWVDAPTTAGIAEAECLLLLGWLGQAHTPPGAACARTLVATQLPNGGWSGLAAVGKAAEAASPGETHSAVLTATAADDAAPVDLDLSVRAWLALRLAGHPPTDEPLQRARRAIRLRGGAEGAGGYTRCWLAMLGVLSWSQCPAILPEARLATRWPVPRRREPPEWTQRILDPLSIVRARRATRCPRDPVGIEELFLTSPACLPVASWTAGPLSRGSLHERTLRGGLVLAERLHVTFWRGPLLRSALRRLSTSTTEPHPAGSCFRETLWNAAARAACGHAPAPAENEALLQELTQQIQIDETTGQARIPWLQTPVADTARVVSSLRQAGLAADHPAILRAVDWLLQQEPPDAHGGWNAGHSPHAPADTETTLLVLRALRESLPDELRQLDAEFLLPGWSPHSADGDATAVLAGHTNVGHSVEIAAMLSRSTARLGILSRGLNWLLRMQRKDGSWGAYGSREHRRDTGSGLTSDGLPPDAGSVALTGQVLQLLGQLGLDTRHPSVQLAMRFCWRAQLPGSGCWPGLPGESPLLATTAAVQGLLAVGCPARDSRLRRATGWLSRQAHHGSWHVAPSQEEPSGSSPQPRTAPPAAIPPDPLATSRAVETLLASGTSAEIAGQGTHTLTATQQPDGSWTPQLQPARTVAGTIVASHPLLATTEPLAALVRARQLA